MGVLCSGYAHARHSGQPTTNVSDNFPSHVFCRVTLKHLPQPLKSHILCFGPLQKPISSFVHPKSAFLGGSPNLFSLSHWNPYISVSWEPIQNYGTP